MGKHTKAENIGRDKKKSPKNKNTKIFPIFMIIVILISAIVAGYFAPKIKRTIDSLGGGKQGILAMMLGHNEETLKNLDEVYFLIIGESGVDDYKLADTMMICSYDPKTQEASLLSIPRDTFVGSNKNAARGDQKINSRYRSGEKMDVLLSDLKKITGLDIKYYVRVDTEALKKLVDLIGGVEFDVPINMKYDDPTQKLHINLKAGKQVLDGKKAEQLLRFRHNNNGTTYPASYGMEDIGRMKTQREFITAVIEKTMKAENLKKIEEVINIGYDYVKTNIVLDEVIDYLPYAVNFNVSNLKTGMLPGESEKCNGIWIYIHDKKKTKTMIEDLFTGTPEQSSEDNQTTNK